MGPKMGEDGNANKSSGRTGEETLSGESGPSSGPTYLYHHYHYCYYYYVVVVVVKDVDISISFMLVMMCASEIEE
mgnify:CR=1 FL=1